MSPADNPSGEREQKIKTILVVDDDAAIRELLTLALEMETPHHALPATDGLQALERVKTQIPALFILDYHLPNMDGLALYDHLHSIEELKGVPALLVSANFPLGEVEKRRVFHITKPFELEELLQMVKQLLDV